MDNIVPGYPAEAHIPTEILERRYEVPALPESFEDEMLTRATELAGGDPELVPKVYQHLRRTYDCIVWVHQNSREAGDLQDKIAAAGRELVEVELAVDRHPASGSKKYFESQGPRTEAEAALARTALPEVKRNIQRSRRRAWLRKRSTSNQDDPS